jgi:endonuclease G
MKNNRKTLYLLASLVVFGGIYVSSLLKDCSDGGSDRNDGRWGRANTDDSYVTGRTAEGTQSVAEGSAAAPTPQEYQMQEAPGEGLSQEVYDNLEQPAPLTSQPEVILCKSAFIVSYNVSTLCPNYVAWRLTPERVAGRVKRLDEFGEDMTLNERTRVSSEDYAGSGYDRGHMCPAGDNKHLKEAMQESFLMTNVCPQNHLLNEGDWNELEQQCRQWVSDYGELCIVCGPIFDSKSPARIGRRKGLRPAVPDRFFKVILSPGEQPKAIGFVYPNRATRAEMRSYAVSVDEVERQTGIDFFPLLPDDQERRLERACNPAAWGI